MLSACGLTQHQRWQLADKGVRACAQDAMISAHESLESGDGRRRCQVVRWERTFPFSFLSKREYVIGRRMFRGPDGSLYGITKARLAPAVLGGTVSAHVSALCCRVSGRACGAQQLDVQGSVRASLHTQALNAPDGVHCCMQSFAGFILYASLHDSFRIMQQQTNAGQIAQEDAGCGV